MSSGGIPIDGIADVERLDDMLSEPLPALVEMMRRIEGDILVLGAAGKMGPTLVRMARRATDLAGVRREVIGVSRFSSEDVRLGLESHGVRAIRCDLQDDGGLGSLPDAPNVVYMVGMKFGATGQEALTWAVNAYLPGRVCRRWPDSRIVAFSTGNVYGATPVVGGGSREEDEPRPTGEYAQSCLGRERLFEHFSRMRGTPVSIIRLNYATEMRYGVLVDIARSVHEGREVDLGMGCLNAIWQADANHAALMALELASSPPCTLNVSGPETLSVRGVAGMFGRLMDKPVRFRGVESQDALLNCAGLSHRLFGYPRVPADTLICWIADWVMRGGESLGKPTHFEVRDGKF